VWGGNDALGHENNMHPTDEGGIIPNDSIITPPPIHTDEALHQEDNIATSERRPICFVSFIPRRYEKVGRGYNGGCGKVLVGQAQ